MSNRVRAVLLCIITIPMILWGSRSLHAQPAPTPEQLPAPTLIEEPSSPSLLKLPKDAPQNAVLPVEPSEEQRVRVERDLDWFARIEDDKPVRSEEQNPDEHKAYNYLLSFASKQDPALLRKYARRNVPYKDLINDIRVDYLQELIHFEGRLVRLTSMKPTQLLKNAGIQTMYEGWLAPGGRVANPICILITELPAGVVADQPIDRWVEFDGYYFKLMWYESQEIIGEPGKERNRVRRAPLFMGRTFTVVEPPNEGLSDGLVGLVGGVIAVVVVVAGGLAWWLSRSDRQIKSKLEDQKLGKNPFAESGSEPNPPQV